MDGFVVVCLLHYNDMNEKQITGSERYRLKLLLTDLFIIFIMTTILDFT